MPRLILASASPRRRELIARLGLDVSVVPSPLEEPTAPPRGVRPPHWALALAYFKARSVRELRACDGVLAADTLVDASGELLGKPRDLQDARSMLCRQAQHPSDVWTGVCLLAPGMERALVAVRTRVWMRDDPREREAYLASGEWRDKAGAYGLQDVGDRLVQRIEGSASNVVGLPLELVARMLRRAGFAVASQE